MRSKLATAVCVGVVAATTAGAAFAAMHPELGARLSGMGEHGIVNLTLKSTSHQVCWTFDIPTKGVTSASIRDAHGMVVAKLGTHYTAKGCATVPAMAISHVETSPTKYRVWVDTKAHMGELRGTLFVGMAHM